MGKEVLCAALVIVAVVLACAVDDATDGDGDGEDDPGCDVAVDEGLALVEDATEVLADPPVPIGAF